MQARKRKVDKPIVAVSGSPFEGNSLEEALNRLPTEQIFNPGDTVVIVPNLDNNHFPNSEAVSDPEILERLIRIIMVHRPGKIVIAAGNKNGQARNKWKEQGYDEVIGDLAEFKNLNHGPYISAEGGGKRESFRLKINSLYEEADCLISFTQLRHDRQLTMSAGMKNIAFNWLPAEYNFSANRHIFEDVHNFIAAMVSVLTVDLSIVSCCRAMVGTGPFGGKPVNADLVIAGTDIVAVDVVSARLLGFLPQAVSYLYTAIKNEVGEGDVEKFQLYGIPLDNAEEIFSKAAYDFRLAVDAVGVNPLQLKKL